MNGVVCRNCNGALRAGENGGHWIHYSTNSSACPTTYADPMPVEAAMSDRRTL